MRIIALFAILVAWSGLIYWAIVTEEPQAGYMGGEP